jgi:crotonobetainyl-CoA:carnitine CoA-transferase CaiB-like acyl-CoA transferase
MTAVMKGVRVVEVAEQAFGPAASAVLSDWGAEVIKVEPAERGDAARGLSQLGNPEVHPAFQNVNRGKQSIGLDLAKPGGREILYRLVSSADVFLTNKLPRVRRSLGIDVEDIRAHNPDIVYVRGTGNGERGPEADRGSYDLLGFWYRAGSAVGAISPQGDIPFLPAPGFGDLMGAMTIAGGIMGALFHRERTGEAPVVDVSLLSTGMWAMGGAIACASTVDRWDWPPRFRNPMGIPYRTKDNRWLALCCLQAGYYWPLFCEVIARPDLAEDPRFAGHATLMANSGAAIEALTAVFAQRTLDEWRQALKDFKGQWAVVQDPLQVLDDEQAIANGYLQPCESADGTPFTLVAPPIQYDEQPPAPRRAPGFNEHGDEILASLGLDWDTIVDLKVRGVVA